MKTYELIKDLVDYLSDIEGATAIAHADFTDERDEDMIAVSAPIVTQLNLGCNVPDYEVQMKVILDCRIAEDKDMSGFNKICDDLTTKLMNLAYKNIPLSNVFPTTVVAFFFDDAQTNLLEHSNEAVFNCRAIVSE